MLSDKKQITKENLDSYLSELAKVFRKMNGTKMPAEIILIGGAAALANYGFRNATSDVDAIIFASSAMKDAIGMVSETLHLPNDWLNADFMQTESYSSKLVEVSQYYRTFSNILTVRTVRAEYLVAMKMNAARAYKHDISDIVGIIGEQKMSGNPLSLEAILNAYTMLYEGTDSIDAMVLNIVKTALMTSDYQALYQECVADETENKETLQQFEDDYPKVLKKENLNTILNTLKEKNRISLSNQKQADGVPQKQNNPAKKTDRER